MTKYKLSMLLAVASLLLIPMTACSGKGYPVALTNTGGNAGSGSGSGGGSSDGSSNGSVTKGSGTTQCGDGTAYKDCMSVPVDKATYNDSIPFSVIATSPAGIVGWQAYVDGHRISDSIATQGSSGPSTGVWMGTIPTGVALTDMDSKAQFTITPGTHTIAINSWDGATDNYKAISNSATIDFVASPLPTPPASATVYKNLQAPTGSEGNWQICNGSCSGSAGTGSSAITVAATDAPTITGSSLEETSTGAAFNTLGYIKPACPTAGCTSVTNFLDDVWFYIPATTTHLQALEFDPDVYDGSFEYFLSMQCDSVSGAWRFWDMKNGDWTTQQNGGAQASYPCTLLTQTGQWHHFQLYGTTNYSTHTYTYQTFVVDGVTVYKDLANWYNAKPYSSGGSIVAEQQIDNNASATANSVYYDNYTLTVW